jgi:transforming growth factor-beta-induced protein
MVRSRGRRLTPLVAALILVACGTPAPSPTAAPPVLPTAPQLTLPEGTVPDVLVRDGRFGTLLAILALTESPQGPPGQQTITPVLDLMILCTWQHTLFAPTDASFAVLPPATLETLMTDAGARLDFVRFHISQRVWAAADLPDAGTIETPGGRVEVSRDGERVMVGEAVIAQADVTATNGVVQVLDGFIGLPD